MSIVDDTNRPIRSDDIPTRGPMASSNAAASNQARGAGNDPLAELARLIGQEDPFREMEREARALRRREAPSIAAPQSANDWSARPDAAARAATGDRRFTRATTPAEPQAAHPQDGSEHHTADGAYAAEHEHDDFYEDGEMPLDDEDHDMIEPRRRSGVMTIAVVLVLSLLGAGGVYGYRSWSNAAAPGPAPVIKAQTEPAKIVPAGQKAESPTKIYDRVGDRGQNDKLIPREEQPLDMKEVVGATTPRAAAPIAASASPGTAATTAAAGSSEPKKVKTIAIRPDMSVAPTSANAPQRTAGYVTPPNIVPVPPRSVPTTTIPAQTAAPAQAAAPTHTAAVASPTANDLGGYLVQVASQRSETDAQATFRSLQAKFPSQLGGWQPIIRRADLGDRGVFYRAQIGPFATADQAQDVCGNLKAAGGQCIVQKN